MHSNYDAMIGDIYIYIYKRYKEANLKYIMGRCQKLHGSRRGDGATNFKK